LSKAKIPLPPLAEQKRIAVILDKADALRTRTRAQLAAYDELLQAVFLEMFGDPVLNEKGWEVKPMKEVVERIQIGPFGSQLHKSDYIQGGIPLINPSNILNQKIKIDEEVSITEPLFSKLSQYNLIENDVVIARRGEMGRCAVVKKDHGKLFCGTGSLFIRTNKRLILPEYLQAFLSSTNIIKFLHNKARGVTMMNLNKKIIGSLEIPVPPCSLQKKYVKSIRLNDQVSKLNKEALTQSDDLFNSLLQRAFRGEL
jgi:type I restriction enzyme S subunit